MRLLDQQRERLPFQTHTHTHTRQTYIGTVAKAALQLLVTHHILSPSVLLCSLGSHCPTSTSSTSALLHQGHTASLRDWQGCSALAYQFWLQPWLPIWLSKALLRQVTLYLEAQISKQKSQGLVALGIPDSSCS